MTKASAVQQQPCQLFSEIQLGTQREDRVLHRNSPTASQRESAMSCAHVQNRCNLVCDCSEVPAAKEPTGTVESCCRGSWMVTWGPAWAQEHKAAPSVCFTCWLRHIHTLQGPLRLHCCCIPESQAAWETGAAHSVLFTCTAVMNSEPANWNINDLVNYRKEPTHSEVCSTIAWLFGMMNTHNSSRFQQEGRGFALL